MKTPPTRPAAAAWPRKCQLSIGLLTLGTILILMLVPGVSRAQLCLDYSEYLHWVAGTDLPGSDRTPSDGNLTAPEIVSVDHPYSPGRRVAFVGVGQGDATPMGWVTAVDVTDPTALARPVADSDQLGTVSFGRRFYDLALDPQFGSGRPYIYCSTSTANMVVLRVDPGVGDALVLTVVREVPFTGTVGTRPAVALGVLHRGTETFAYIYRTGSSTFVNGGLAVYDLADPENPALVTSINPGNGAGGELIIHPNGQVLYITQHFGGFVVDIANPRVPVVVRSIGAPNGADMEISADARYLYVSGVRSDSPTDASFRPLWVLDILDPLLPVKVGEGAIENGFEGGGSDMALRGSLLYQTYDDGLRVIDVSDPAAPRVIGTAEATSEPHVNQLGQGYGACLEGNFALVSSGLVGLQVLDITNGASPERLAHVSGIAANAVEVSDGLAVTLGGSVFHVTDVSNPLAPVLVGSGALGNTGQDIAALNDTVYVLTRAALEIWSLAVPSAPVRLGLRAVPAGFGTGTDVLGLEVAESGGRRYAYFGIRGTLPIFDVTNPAAITNPRNLFVGSFFIRDLEVDCGRLYIASSAGVDVRSLGNPTNPPLLGTWRSANLYGLFVDGRTAYGVGSSDPGFVLLDVANPAAISQVGSFDMIESHAGESGVNGDVVVLGGHAYVTWCAGGLFVFDVSNPAAPVARGGSNPIYNYDNNFGLGSDVLTERDVFVAGGVVYNADGPRGLFVHSTQCGPDGLPPEPEPHRIVLTVPPEITVTTDALTCGAVVTDEMLGAASATEACPGDVVTITRTGVPAGNLFAPDTTTVIYTATDTKGRMVEAGQLVIVVDATAPSLAAPPALGLSAEAGACERALANVDLGTPTAFDACGVTVGNDAPESFPIGETTVTWTAVDPSGNTTTATQVVTILDSEPPTITAPADLDLVAGPGDGACALVIDAETLGAATASDNCSDVTVTAAGIPDENSFPTGTTTVTWTAVDAAGNSATAEQTVTVRCPYGDLAGSATLTCDPSSAPASGVTVRLLHEGVPIRESLSSADGSFLFEDVRLGTYTVAVVPPAGYGIDIDTRVVTLVEDGAVLALDPFVFTCLLRDLEGSVVSSCGGSPVGLHGVTVDLYRADGSGTDVLVGTVATASDGSFRFDDLALGDYSVHIVLPLGYAGTTVVPVTLEAGSTPVALTPVDLSCLPMTAEPRGLGYWKHQVNVYLTGKGHPHETLDDLLAYTDAMVEHFNENLVNPVIVYVPMSTVTTDKLLQLQQLLTVNRGGTSLDRAKQHLLALLLNVVSGKIGQTAVISADGATVSQAITHAHDLIVDGDPSNDVRAGDISEAINSGSLVPAGWIPVGTRVITYDEQRPAVPVEAVEIGMAFAPVTPNPSRGAFTVMFRVAAGASAEIEVLDVTGRRVAGEVVSAAGGGDITLRLGENGALAAGKYFVRIHSAGKVVTRSVIVTR